MNSRGFMSIALVLIALVPVFLFADSYLKVHNSATDAKNSALLAERDYYQRADIRNALISEMREGAKSGGSPEMVAENVANRLSANASKIAELYEDDGVSVEFWCGFADENDILRMANRTTTTCAGCMSFDYLITDGIRSPPDEEIPCFSRHLCSFLLSANNTLKVSAADYRVTDGAGECVYFDVLALTTLFFGKPTVFGASIYDSKTNTSSVVVIPQGYWIDYVQSPA